MTLHPYKDMANLRAMQINANSSVYYPTGVSIGQANRSATVQKFSDSQSTVESECIFAGASNPQYHAFIHRLVALKLPSGDEQMKLDAPLVAGDGTISWQPGTVRLPVISQGVTNQPDGMHVDLGIFMGGGFRVSFVTTAATAGEYALIYELIPVRS